MPDARTSILLSRASPPADVLIRGAHVLDPRDRDRRAARRARPRRRDRRARGPARARPRASRSSTARAGTCFPGFVDPHVHLRTPGQEHKEDLDSGTRAAAAGGFVAVVAMPNTDPTVDCAPVLRSLREAARRDARVPVGFLASVTLGLAGESLTEMAELRDAGALGLHRRRQAGPAAPRCCARRCSTSGCAAACSRCTRRTRRCRAPASCTRARCRRGSAWPGSLDLGVDDDRPRRRDRGLRGRAHPRRST